MTPINLQLYDTMREWSDKPCISFGKRTLRYSDICDLSDQLYTHLSDAFKLEGKIVAIRCTSSIDFLVFTLTLIRLGAIIFPIAHDVPSEGVKDQIEQIRVEYLLSTIPADFLKLPHTLAKIQLRESELTVFKFDLTPVHVSSFGKDRSGFVRFTSGTTGKAKGVYISLTSATERVQAVSKTIPLKPQDTVLNLMPCAYHFIVSLLHFLRCGVHILIPRSNTILMIVELENLPQTNVIYAAPYHYDVLLGLDANSFGTQFKAAICTGDILPEHTRNRFFEKFKIKIQSAYGLIEVGLPIVSSNDLDITLASGSVGKVCEPYQVKIFERDEGTDNTGILGISGPGMFDAYLAPFIPRQRVLRDGWFVTGDRATILKSGEILIHGRESAVIKFMGHKIYPQEIEMILNQFPEVSESQVFGKSDPTFGNIIVAKLVVSETHKIDEERLKRFCRSKLEKFKIPRQFEYISSIEKTETGKIKRVLPTV